MCKKGSWITLAEYDNQYRVLHVKTEQVDGERIKEDVFYTLCNKEFHEIEEIDGVKTVILKRKKNVCKVKICGNDEESFVFSKDGVNAHGKTVKQAYRDWLFKNSDRDVSKYENLSPDEILPLEYWYECYRTITGACASGTEWFIDTHKPKAKMTLKEVLEITKGQYNYHLFEEFFEVKAND